MRVPFGSRTFDYVFNFFTSFGYFDADEDHQTVVRNMAAALKDGGRLVLDYVNVHHAERHLTPREEKTIDGIAYRITRSVDRGFFVKRIVIDDGGAGGIGARGAGRAVHGRRLRSDARCPRSHHRGGLRGLRARRLRRADVAAIDSRGAEERRRIYFRASCLRMRLMVSGDTPRYDASIHCGTRWAIVGKVCMKSR